MAVIVFMSAQDMDCFEHTDLVAFAVDDVAVAPFPDIGCVDHGPPLPDGSSAGAEPCLRLFRVEPPQRVPQRPLHQRWERLALPGGDHGRRHHR